MEIYRWRPRTRISDFVANRVFGVRHVLSRFPARMPNFGDELGPLIVHALLERLGISRSLLSKLTPRPTFFSIGSVLPLVRNGDHVWGTGHLGGKAALVPDLSKLNVYATRGPLSRQILKSHGVPIAGATFGDPGILAPTLFSFAPKRVTSPRNPILIPHIDDHIPRNLPRDLQVITASTPVMRVIEAVAKADLVVTSSLHAKILADSYGTPSVIYRGRTTTKFKFDDYALGAGQDELHFAVDSGRALDEAPYVPRPSGKVAEQLVRAFPKNIWS